MICMRTNLTFPTTSRERSLNAREFCAATVKNMKNFLMKLSKRRCLNLFCTWRMKMLSRPDGFMLYGKLGVDFFSISELLYPNMKYRLRLIRARPKIYMITDNPNVSLGIVDVHFTLVALLSKMIITRNEWTCLLTLLWSSVEFNYSETLAKTFIIPARQNQFIQENFSNNAPVRRIAIARNTNSAFTGYYTENRFWYH